MLNFIKKTVKRITEIVLDLIFWLPERFIPTRECGHSKLNELANDGFSIVLDSFFFKRSDLYPIGYGEHYAKNKLRLYTHHNEINLLSLGAIRYYSAPIIYLFTHLLKGFISRWKKDAFYSFHNQMTIYLIHGGLQTAIDIYLYQRGKTPTIGNVQNAIIFPIQKLFDVNAKNASGLTELHMALFREDKYRIEDLIRNGADINITLTENEINLVPYSGIDLLASFINMETQFDILAIINARISNSCVKIQKDIKNILNDDCKLLPSISDICYDYCGKNHGQVLATTANTERGKNMLKYFDNHRLPLTNKKPRRANDDQEKVEVNIRR